MFRLLPEPLQNPSTSTYLMHHNTHNRKQVKAQSCPRHTLTFTQHSSFHYLNNNIYYIDYQSPEALTLELLTQTYPTAELSLDRDASETGFVTGSHSNEQDVPDTMS